MWVDRWADNRGVQKSAKHVGLQDTLNTRSRNLVEDVDSLDARWEDRPEFCLIPRLQYADDHDAKARSTACNRLGSQSKRTIEDDKNRLRMLVSNIVEIGITCLLQDMGNASANVRLEGKRGKAEFVDFSSGTVMVEQVDDVRGKFVCRSGEVYRLLRASKEKDSDVLW